MALTQVPAALRLRLISGSVSTNTLCYRQLVPALGAGTGEALGSVIQLCAIRLQCLGYCAQSTLVGLQRLGRSQLLFAVSMHQAWHSTWRLELLYKTQAQLNTSVIPFLQEHGRLCRVNITNKVHSSCFKLCSSAELRWPDVVKALST